MLRIKHCRHAEMVKQAVFEVTGSDCDCGRALGLSPVEDSSRWLEDGWISSSMRSFPRESVNES